MKMWRPVDPSRIALYYHAWIHYIELRMAVFYQDEILYLVKILKFFVKYDPTKSAKLSGKLP